MKEEIKDTLGVNGEVIEWTIKTKKEWIQNAREIMDRAEKYGAKTPKEMNEKDKLEFEKALKAIGVDIKF